MKKYLPFLFTFFLLYILSSCNNDSLDLKNEYSFYDRISEIDSFNKNNQFLNEYRETFSELLYTIKKVNLQKSKEDIDSLILNYQRVLTSTPNDSAIYSTNLISTFNSIYSNNELKEIDLLLKRLIEVGQKLSNDRKIKAFNSHENNLFQESLSVEVLELNNKMNLLNKKIIKTRSENSNSECLNNCKEAYYWDLLTIAGTVICSSGAVIVESCFSLGSLSIPALIQLIATYSIASIELDAATIDYERCIKQCNNY